MIDIDGDGEKERKSEKESKEGKKEVKEKASFRMNCKVINCPSFASTKGFP